MRITVRGAGELRHAQQVLRRAKGTVRRDLTAAWRTAGQDTLREVKQNIESMPMKGFRVRRRGEKVPRFRARMAGTRIRARISRVTELEVSSGGDPRVRFLVRADKLGSARRLPAHFDRGKQFRHPIMGSRTAWAGQQGRPWFRQTILRDIRDFRTASDAAIDRALTTIRQEM